MVIKEVLCKLMLNYMKFIWLKIVILINKEWVKFWYSVFCWFDLKFWILIIGSKLWMYYDSILINIKGSCKVKMLRE